MFSSLTLIQGGAERPRGRRSDPCVSFGLDQYAVFGGGLEVAQNNVLHLSGGAHTQALPPSELFVVLPVADEVAAKDPVCELWFGGLMRGEAGL